MNPYLQMLALAARFVGVLFAMLLILIVSVRLTIKIGDACDCDPDFTDMVAGAAGLIAASYGVVKLLPQEK